MKKIEREKSIIGLMIRVYCQRKHDSRKGDLCEDCGELLDYALERLSHCPHGNDKGSCRKCAIHCYSPRQRERIKEVMRFVGPKMLFISPMDAIRHVLSEMH